METDLILCPPIQPPATLTDLYAEVNRLDIGIETVNTLSYWVLGEYCRLLEENFSVKKSAEALARESRFDARTIGYSRKVRQVFSYERLSNLARLGLTWSAVRELAGDKLEHDRERLLALFEAGEITPLELYNQAVAIRSGKPVETSDVSDEEGGEGGDQEPLDKRFNKTVKQLSKEAAGLREKVAQAYLDFRHDLGDALLDDDARQDAKKVEQLDDTANTLNALVKDAVALIGCLKVVLNHVGWPFDELEVELERQRGSQLFGGTDHSLEP